MKCLVIGGSGFVGRWLVKELLDSGMDHGASTVSFLKNIPYLMSDVSKI